jgi:hypothetical protein
VLHRYFGAARVRFNNIFCRDLSQFGDGSQDDLLVGHRSTSASSSTLWGRSDEGWPWLNARTSNPRVHNEFRPYHLGQAFFLPRWNIS